MIIKRKKVKKNNTEPEKNKNKVENMPVVEQNPFFQQIEQKISTPAQTGEETFLQKIKEKKERRKDDRRIGYRRIDDRNLISRAHEEADLIKEKASKEGFDYGISQADQEIEQLKEAITQFLEAKQIALSSVKGDVVDIALKVAEKLIKTKISEDDEIVLNVVSSVIKEVGKNESSITIKANPTDYQIIKENIPNIYPYGNSKTTIDVIEDENIEWGSCIVQTNNGMIDASFKSQLQILRKALEQELKEE